MVNLFPLNKKEKLNIMIRRNLHLIIPSVVSVLLFIWIIRPGFFNLIPFTIHENFLKGIIKEHTFIYIFDALFCLLVWVILYKILPKN